MATHSAIEWTDTTWNPLAGCTRASEGCDNCYAAGMAIRLEAMALADLAAGKDPGGKRKYIGVARRNAAGRAAFIGKINLDESALREPLSWKKARKVFVNSMSDLFHRDVPTAFIDSVFAVMALAHAHTFQVLTKRPELMASYLNDPTVEDRINTAMDAIADPAWCDREIEAWPLPNVWCGTSVEHQAAADARIPHLLRVPAVVRFLSCEPLLGPLDLTGKTIQDIWIDQEYADLDSELGRVVEDEGWPIHWIIVGGESGHGARPMNPEWVRSLRDQCQGAGVAFYFKQFGEYAPANAISESDRTRGRQWIIDRTAPIDYSEQNILYRVGKHAAGRELDRRTWDQFPA